MDQLNAMIAYEEGTISYQDFIELFSNLIKSGLCWQLQGFYGRTAMQLIDEGLITEQGRITQLAYSKYDHMAWIE
jgi:hypothetical protein